VWQPSGLLGRGRDQRWAGARRGDGAGTLRVRHDEGGMTGGDDAELMARYGSGDERAAHEVYERFAGRVMTVALGMLGKRDQAEEVVQETLLKLYRSAASYDGSRPLNPWVHQIARNAAIDVYRRDRRAPEPAASEQLEDQDPVDIDPFERSWLAWEVRAAVDQLPEIEGQAVRLAHLEGMTHGGIAQALEVPAGTVKSRLNRAYKRLHQRLSEAQL
jgi:RNA polymerase sigma-70 factor, ECF subfamily